MTRRFGSFGALCVGLVGALLFGSCASDPAPLGGLMLMIGRDGPLPIDQLELHVQSKGRTLRRNSYEVPGEAPLPTTLAIASNGDPRASVEITVVGWQGEVPVDRRDAIVIQVPTDRVAALTVLLSARCRGKVELDGDEAISTCGEGGTCDPRTGGCTSSEVDAETLPTYAAGAEDGIEGGSGAGGQPGSAGADAGGAGTGGSVGGTAGEPSSGGAGAVPSGGGAGGEANVPECGIVGADCGEGAECCSGYCDGQTCALMTSDCTGDGLACAQDGECCGGKCDTTCVALNPACKTAGNPCQQDGDCCSELCGPEQTCVPSSYCAQEGDACSAAGDCCSGRCDKLSGASLGVCVPTPANASCTGVVGSLCGDCGDCCSRLCVPYAPTGKKVCAPASGCRATGDLCLVDADCCGGDIESGAPGAGNAICDLEGGGPFGRCRNPMSCNPQGNTCKYASDFSCNLSAARNNCCAGIGNNGVCEIDAHGVARCNGLGDECRIADETCSSSNDCCDGRPCVPDASQVMRCSAALCQPEGERCTIDGDCCVGTMCNRALGSSSGVCGDGPLVEGRTCALYGQACADIAECCDGVPCTMSRCVVPPE